MARRDRFLSDVELEIMFYVWGSKRPLTSKEILENLPRAWRLSTLMTVLARWEKKEMLFCDRSTSTNMYSALKTREQHLAGICSYIMNVHNVDAAYMLTALCCEGVIGKEQLAEAARQAASGLQEGAV